MPRLRHGAGVGDANLSRYYQACMRGHLVAIGPWLLVANACVADHRLHAHDHRSLFWSGRVNVDPRPPDRRREREGARYAFRPGIEVEANGVDDLARTTAGNGRVDDYREVVGTLAWSPEMWFADVVGLGVQVGVGGHDAVFVREIDGRREELSDSGIGVFAAVEVGVRPLSFLQAYARGGAYQSDDFATHFTELGVKVGCDPAWLFAAWRRTELDLGEHPSLVPDLDRIEVDTDGVMFGVELRF